MSQYAYLAGLIDGDGCFYISEVTALIEIVSVSREFLEEVQRFAGGRISGNKYFKLWWSGRKASEITELVLPFLIYKKEQAQLFVLYVNRMPGRGKLPGGMPKRRDMDWHNEAKTKMMELNRVQYFGDQ